LQTRADARYHALMATNPMVSARVDPSLIARLERCAEGLNTRAEPGTPAFDRGAVMRLLVLRALPGLEAELGIAALPAAKTKPAKGRK